MTNAEKTPTKTRGEQLKVAERNVLISKLIDKLCEGYSTTAALSKELHVSRRTIDRYRPAADEIIGKFKLDRNVIRNLQIRRTYELIEMLMQDLKQSTEYKQRTAYYTQIFKFSSHLALITGLNVETHVNIDPTKLVIIRSNNGEKQRKPVDIDLDAETSDSVNSLPDIEPNDVYTPDQQ